MITLDNVTKTYHTEGGDVEALRGVSLELPDSGLFCIVGKSGCGKSTLLNILGGMDTPTSGSVLLDGKSPEGEEARAKVSYVFQDFGLFPFLSAEENIRITGCSKEEATALLRLVGLEGFGKRSMRTLSGGEQQRLAIARALSRHCEVILADEPTGNLDEDNAEDVFKTFVEISKSKLVVVVTHDAESAELFADTIIYLSDGTVRDIKTAHAKKEPITDAEQPAEQAEQPVPVVVQPAKGWHFGRDFKFALALLRRGKGRSLVFCLLLTLFFCILFAVQAFISANTLQLALWHVQENGVECVSLGRDAESKMTLSQDTVQYLKENTNVILSDIQLGTEKLDLGVVYGQMPELEILEGSQTGGVLLSRSFSSIVDSRNLSVGELFGIFGHYVPVAGIFEDRQFDDSQQPALVFPKVLVSENFMPDVGRTWTARKATVFLDENGVPLLKELASKYRCTFTNLGYATGKDGQKVDMTPMITKVGGIVDKFGGIGAAVAVALGVVIVLYVVYFTAFFVSESKREIAILRVFGVNAGEIKLIFLLQSCFLYIISLILAVAAAFILFGQLNVLLYPNVAFTMFRINGYSALIAAGALAVCVASSLLPLLRLKKMKLNPMMKNA